MATRTKPAAKAAPKPRKTAAKAAPKRTATKTKPAAAATRVRRDLASQVPDIVRKLKAGTTMTDIRAEYGAGPAIRKALMEKGYNTKGERIEVMPLNGTGQVLAKRVATRRETGEAWYSLELATGKTEAALKQLLADNGYEALAQGRVSAAAEAKPAKRTTKAAAKPAAKKTAAKAPAKAAVKPRRVARKVNP